ncbi:hypothetical protein MNBD_BACTEROID03-2269 [hydrothermal vent metagenome]|uniref:Uncharacterized protein n=1 Tax=hydrothermal vent metagenome TaxID=652676 RepID=A0A3B0TIH0_9ZZZZ
MEKLLETIKERKEDRISQALAILDMGKEQFQTEQDKRHLLSIAARNLDDPKVSKKWIELLRTEENTATQELLISLLPNINLRILKNVDILTEVTLSSFETASAEAKVILVRMLDKILKTNSAIAENIVLFLKKEQHIKIKEQLAEALIHLHTIPEEFAEIYEMVLPKLKERQQIILLNKLIKFSLLKKETIIKYLVPTTPSSIKLRLLNYLQDRDIVPVEQLRSLLQKEGDKEVKEYILRFFANDTKNLNEHLVFFKNYIIDEQDTPVREAALDFLYKNIEMTSEMILFYIDLLKTEKEISISWRIAEILTPYLSQDHLETSEVNECFLGILEKPENSYHIELLLYLCEELGKRITFDNALFDRMLLIYKNNTDAKIQENILFSFCNSSKLDNRLTPLYVDAVQSPVPSIREYACRGLLPLPLTEKYIPHLLAAIPLLLDSHLKEHIRAFLALRIVAIPDKSQELIDQLKNVAQNGSGKERSICEKGYEKTLQAQNLTNDTPEVDWHLWENRIKVEKRADHIFPDLLIHYDNNPTLANELLKTLLIDSDCADSLYRSTYITKRTIVEFLIANDAIDQEIALFCLDYLTLVGYGRNKEDNVFLVALNNCKDLSLLKEKLWLFFERNLTDRLSFLNTLLLRHVMCNAYGNNAALAKAFSDKLLAFTNEKAATPYLEFLFMSLDWKPIEEITDQILKRPDLVDKNIKDRFDGFVIRLGKEVEIDFDATSGFAD